MRRGKVWFAGFLMLFLVLLPLSGCGTQTIPVDPDKQLTEFTKPAVVRVVSINMMVFRIDSTLANYLGLKTEIPIYDGGFGSGAILSENGYIVTNAHVVETTRIDEKEAKDRIIKSFIQALYEKVKSVNPQRASDIMDYAIETTKPVDFKRYSRVILPGGDDFAFDIKSYGAPLGEGKDVAVIKIDTNNLPVVSIDDTDKSQTSDKVVIAGYPGKADLEGYLDDKSVLVSSYTNGSIAARKSSDKGPIIQLDANINPGNSGGPVFAKDGKMIGIATATSKDGIGWAVPASTILEFARQAGATINQPGVTTKLWQEGIALFWQNDFKMAIPKLEEVKRLYPKHYAVEDYISKAQKGIAEGKNRKDINDYLPYIIGIAVVVIAGVIIVVVLIRKKKEPPTQPTISVESIVQPSQPKQPQLTLRPTESADLPDSANPPTPPET